VNGLCSKCRQTTRLDGVIAPFDYQNPLIRAALTAAKYNNGWDAIICLWAALSDEIIRRLPRGDWHYAYIPQTKKREAWRGYNQSEILAKLLSKGEVFSGVKKIRETAAQASLTKAERITNLKNAFKVIDRPPEEIVLCDDIVTTGSTLSALARLLRKAGAKRIWAITLAHD
jgi:ComF family protein